MWGNATISDAIIRLAQAHRRGALAQILCSLTANGVACGIVLEVAVSHTCLPTHAVVCWLVQWLAYSSCCSLLTHHVPDRLTVQLADACFPLLTIMLTFSDSRWDFLTNSYLLNRKDAALTGRYLELDHQPRKRPRMTISAGKQTKPDNVLAWCIEQVCVKGKWEGSMRFATYMGDCNECIEGTKKLWMEFEWSPWITRANGRREWRMWFSCLVWRRTFLQG